jgi:hypothetical protein
VDDFVNKGSFTVVNVSNDGDISYFLHFDFLQKRIFRLSFFRGLALKSPQRYEFNFNKLIANILI